MRVQASTWATANGMDFVFDNSIGTDPTIQPSQPTLVWSFQPDERERLTSGCVEHRGSCVGTIMMPALPASTSTGNPVSDRMALANGLVAAFRGQRFADALVLDESAVRTVVAPAPMAAIQVDIAWHYSEATHAGGQLPAASGAGSEQAYNAWRSLWSGLNLGLTVYFDGIPPGLAVRLPAAICSFSVSPGIPVDMQTTLHTGSVNCGLHYPLETGVQSAHSDVQSIVAAFDSVSVGTVAFGSPRTANIGRTAGDTWQVNVLLPFVFQDIFSS